MDVIRTFIAIDIKPEAMLMSIFAKLKLQHKLDSIKWVDEKTLHLTLFFLGDVPVGQISQISASLREKISTINSFDILIRNLGTFGKPQPKVIWIGIDKNELLNSLKEVVNQTLLPYGFEDENKTFVPHLTLGRVKFLKDKSSLDNLILQYKQKEVQQVKVDKVILYKSTLTNTGPIYQPLEIISLC